MKRYYIYIMAHRSKTLYIGVTNNQRVEKVGMAETWRIRSPTKVTETSSRSPSPSRHQNRGMV